MVKYQISISRGDGRAMEITYYEKYEEVLRNLLVDKIREWLADNQIEKRTISMLGKRAFPERKDGARKIRWWMSDRTARNDIIGATDLRRILGVMGVEISNFFTIVEYFYQKEISAKQKTPPVSRKVF